MPPLFHYGDREKESAQAPAFGRKRVCIKKKSPDFLEKSGLFHGGAYWTRTSDPIDVNDVLYQLSQSTGNRMYYSTGKGYCQPSFFAFLNFCDIV